MAIVVQSKLTSEMYTPEQERSAKDPTRFKLRPLSGVQYLDVISYFVEGTNGQKLSAKGMEQVLSYGVVKAENLFNDKGKQTQALEYLDPITTAELVSRIMELSEIRESERKN